MNKADIILQAAAKIETALSYDWGTPGTCQLSYVSGVLLPGHIVDPEFGTWTYAFYHEGQDPYVRILKERGYTFGDVASLEFLFGYERFSIQDPFLEHGESVYRHKESVVEYMLNYAGEVERGRPKNDVEYLERCLASRVDIHSFFKNVPIKQ